MMENTSIPLKSMTTNVNIELTTVGENLSFPEGCQKVVFRKMDFVPWNNPDNIVSAEAEAFINRLKDNVLVLLFLIGGPGNVINMAVFYKQGLKDRVNLCLFALASADELYLITAMFLHAEQVHLQFTSKEIYGPMFIFLANNKLTGFLALLYVSLVLSAIIASERCICVLDPLKFKTLMRTRTMLVIIVAVFIVVTGPLFIVSFRIHIGCMYDPLSGTVFLKTPVLSEFYQNYKDLVDYIDIFIYGVGVPGFAMTLVITTTIITAWKLRQIVSWRATTSASSSSSPSSQISSSEITLTKMLIGSSILFIVCVFPFALTRVCWLVFPELNTGRRHQNFYLTTLWTNKLLTYFNASLNIFVYYSMGSRYRETCWQMFSCCRAKARSQKEWNYRVSPP